MPIILKADSNFNGIITPMITPLLDDQTIDIEGLNHLIDHIIKGGVHGLFVLGTTGEAASLSDELKTNLIQLACAKADEKIPVFVGVTNCSLNESILLANIAEEAGASAVVVAPPYYFESTQKELIAYYERLADKSPLPLFLYNLPAQTKISIQPESVRYLSDHPNIIGIKDSSGNAIYYNTIIHTLNDIGSPFSLFVGPDEMLASTILMGGHGGVNSGSNLFPKLYVDLYKASIAKDMQLVLSLQKRVMEVSVLIYNSVKTTASSLKGIKASLSLLGICSGHIASPLIKYEDQELNIIKNNLESINHNNQLDLKIS